MGNLLFETLVRFSKENLPILVNDNFQMSVEKIWDEANRKNRVIFDCVQDFRGQLLKEIVASAQAEQVEGIKVRNVDGLNDNQQNLLATNLLTLKPSQMGKFIFTYQFRENITEKFKNPVCDLTNEILKQAGLVEDQEFSYLKLKLESSRLNV